MAKKKKKVSGDPVCDCGEFTPVETDQELTIDMTPEQIISQVQLICDDNTGVCFFRCNRKLYLRVVEVST